MSLWIVNASPLILLGKLGHLEWLTQLAPDFRIPRSVAAEVMAGPETDAARIWLDEDAARLRVVDDQTPLPQVLAWDLGAGETAVICHVLSFPGAVAVLDDRAARNCALVFGVPVVGTVGVMLRAKQAGFLPRLAPELERLQKVGSLLGQAVIAEALRLAGEEQD